jgi:hypothetical protein
MQPNEKTDIFEPSLSARAYESRHANFYQGFSGIMHRTNNRKKLAGRAVNDALPRLFVKDIIPQKCFI